MEDTTVIDDLVVEARTEKAFLVEIEGEDQWVPFSQLVSPDEGDVRKGARISIEIPSWLARKYGVED